MQTDKLYKIAEENNISVEGFPLPENKAVTLVLGEKYFVAMDPSVMCSESQEKVCLAHEIGHCREGAVYSENADQRERNKKEQKATRWAINNLVPLDALKEAIKNGCHDTALLADHFGVTADFMNSAIQYYINRLQNSEPTK